MDGGLIQKAKDATDTHTIGAEKEALAIGYAAYQMDLAKNGSATLTVKGSSSITKTANEGWDIAFKVNSYHLDKNGNITKGNGSTTTVGWKDNGDDTFTKGDVTVKLGDKVTYNVGTEKSTTVDKEKSGYSSDQTSKTEKNLGWRVLGINSKGEIELISDNPTSTSLHLEGEKGYLNAKDILNNMCNELYGKGEHATGARSLNVEDINKLGNYDPTTYSGYGDIYTYRFPTSGDYKQYKITKADGTLVKDWTNITTPSAQTFRMPGKTEKISANNRGDIGRSVEFTYYSYTVADKVKQITSDGKKMSDIISNGTGSSAVTQWLASRCVRSSIDAYFNVRYVNSGVGSPRALFCSTGLSPSFDYYVRPVVFLESDIQLSGNSNDGWTIN